MKRFIFFLQIISSLALCKTALSQKAADTLLQEATLQNCVQYAMKHQPILQQSLLDEQITEKTIKSKLSDWFPQLDFSFNLTHYFQLQTSIFAGQPTQIGVPNSSNGGFNLKQNIFNRDVLLASRSAGDVRAQVKQTTAGNRIEVAVNVSKAFYDVLLTQKQIALLDEDIVRLSQSLKDSYNQYQGGLVDKTDYKRATIALNNSKAQRRTYDELLRAKYAYLREQMGYPVTGGLNLLYDSLQMENEAFMDTTQAVNYENRIEWQMLKTMQNLQVDNLKYYKWAYIPSVSAFGSYNFYFLNQDLSQVYNRNYPYSYAGLQVDFPIFQGTKRTQEIRKAELQLQRVDYDLASLKSSVNTQFVQAMAVYKSNLNNYAILRENLELARDVYNTIQLQYKSGIKAYLEVINAETDIRSAQVNYTDALYQVLSSKLDVQKALGTININY